MAKSNLCRLCGKEDLPSKDLLLEGNKSVRKMVQEFTQIIVYDSDDLPTKICLNCEEKMVTFQLFLLECYKVQEILQVTFKAKVENTQIKCEFSTNVGVTSLVKSEINDEMTTEEIVSALQCSNNDMVMFGDEHDDDFQSNNDEIEEDLDDVTLATLKQIKNDQIKKYTQQNLESLNEILRAPSFKVKDIVKFDCIFCNEKLKTWAILQDHYTSLHKTKPVLICLCGYEIRSQTLLYKHVSIHKQESRKLRREAATEEERQDELKYSNINVNDFVKFICNECDLKFSSWYRLAAHSKKIHKILPIVQCKCGITLKSKSVMYKHVHYHKNPNSIACDECPHVSKSVAALNKHKMRHVPKSERKFHCSGCEKIFNTKDALRSHMKSHIPIENRKIYHCDVCNLKFTTRSSAASHKKVVHLKVKGYVCDLCGYACGTNGELRQHRAIHSDDKPFVCYRCTKPFKTYSNLKTHLDTHEDTSYECDICQRVLNSRRTLRKHLLVHEEKCRHVCSYCNKAFKRRQTLKVHMYTHTGDKPLTCKWCDERFAYASSLRSHRLRYHPEKMSMSTQHEYDSTYDEYIKNNVVGGVPVSKNEVEAM